VTTPLGKESEMEKKVVIKLKETRLNVMVVVVVIILISNMYMLVFKDINI